jgi:hypothetical protein
MPMFQTFADYDKWRRRTLLQRLQRLQKLPAPIDSVVGIASAAGAPGQGVTGSGPSPALAAAAAPAPIPSAPLSNALRRAILQQTRTRNAVTPALQQILRDTIIGFLDTGGFNARQTKRLQKRLNRLNRRLAVTGPGPDTSGRAGGTDVVMSTHDGTFAIERGGQLTGIPSGQATDNYCMSLFINIVSQKTATKFVVDGSAANRAEELFFTAAGAITVVGKNWLGGSTGSDTTAGNILTPSTRSHIMMSVSLANNEFKLWIDGVAVVDEAIAGGAAPLGNETNWFFGSNESDLFPPDSGDQFGSYWVGNEYIADPVGVFIEAAGVDPTPLTGGDDGSEFTGTQPLVYFNATADWNSGTNRGTGGDYTVNGGAMS